MEERNMDTGVGAPDLDALYELLSDSHRRYVLYYLLERDHVNVDRLSLQIAGWDQDVQVEAVSEDAVNRVTVSLVHNHLPRLSDHGLLNYDHRSGDIVVGEQFDAIRSTVERARTIEQPDLTVSDSAESFLYSDPLTEPDDQ